MKVRSQFVHCVSMAVFINEMMKRTTHIVCEEENELSRVSHCTDSL